KVFIPHYTNLKLGVNSLKPVPCELQVLVGEKKYPVTLHVISLGKTGVQVYFIGNERFFSREGVYLDPDTGKDYEDNDERFVFFSRAVLAVMRQLDYKPDVVHAHDWQTALIPVYLKTTDSDDSFFSSTRSVLTIHNLAYQGKFKHEHFSLLGLGNELFLPATGAFEFYGKVNFLKGGIFHADRITTVSQKYADEIQTQEFGCGLEGVLSEQKDKLTGILNGVDYTIWSPSCDNQIYARYHIANLSGKRTNKIELLGEAGMPVRDKVPLIGLVSRLEKQKGWDLVANAADRLLKMNIQMAVIGTGQQKYHDLVKELQVKYPDKFHGWLTFDDVLAHRIEAASDIFLMPSQFEPCGLNQMYSLKYGTVPIVRKVGGLADTVVDYDPNTAEGTGFVFEEYSTEAMLEAVERAVNLFSKKRAWTKVMKNGMKQNFSWSRSAAQYVDLYQELISD
ncbi:MAG: glycogen synthase GlgA, partial [Candidatus Zixiibacteriota bacterium]